jgi:hypothetical protein
MAHPLKVKRRAIKRFPDAFQYVRTPFARAAIPYPFVQVDHIFNQAQLTHRNSPAQLDKFQYKLRFLLADWALSDLPCATAAAIQILCLQAADLRLFKQAANPARHIVADRLRIGRIISRRQQPGEIQKFQRSGVDVQHVRRR